MDIPSPLPHKKKKLECNAETCNAYDGCFCHFREKDVDIAFAQDAIDEYKVACN